MLRRWLTVLVLLGALTGCGEGNSGELRFVATPTPITTATPSVAEELAATGVGNFLDTISPTAMVQNGEWEEYTYDPSAEQAICLGGSRYQVNLRRGTSNNVLLYLEGGGACWDFNTCWMLRLAKITANGAQGLGILDFADATNPFADWNIIFASYCDGSVFAGNNIVDYQSDTSSVVKHTYHHGIQNLSAAVNLMVREFPHPDQLVVSGSSAGGYGTYTGYAVTRIAYPDHPILVFDDSGPGLQNSDDTAGVQDRNINWKFLQYIPATCTDCAIQQSYLTDWAMDRDPTLRASLFSYLQDGVIRSFLFLDGPQYQTLLTTITDDVHQRHPDRFKRFFKKGNAHTVLELPSFYALTVAGTTVRDWTVGFLADGPAWQDLIDQ